MLEIDVEELRESTLAEQQYWLYAIEAARQAGTRALELSKGTTCNWVDIMKDGKFVLQTTNPLPVEEMEEDTAPPDQESESPQPAPAQGEEMAEATEEAEPQDAVPSLATMQSAGASSYAAQTARRGGKPGSARRTCRRRGVTDKDRPKKNKTDKSKHRGRAVPTPANPRGRISQGPVP